MLTYSQTLEATRRIQDPVQLQVDKTLKTMVRVGLSEKAKLNERLEGGEGSTMEISAEGPVVEVSLVDSR